MPRHNFAAFSESLGSFAEIRNRKDLNTVNSHIGSHPVLGVIFSRFDTNGSSTVSEEEILRLNILKIRQGLNFLDEAKTQMEQLSMILTLHAEDKFAQTTAIAATSKGLQYGSSTAGAYAGGTLGGIVGGLIGGPPGAVFFGAGGATLGSMAGKRIYKNLEKETSDLCGINVKNKSLYPSVKGIDNELSKAYALRLIAKNNTEGLYASETMSQFKSTMKAHLEKEKSKYAEYTKYIPFSDIAELGYQRHKAKGGLKNDKLAKISWLLQEVSVTVNREKELVQKAFSYVFPDNKDPDIGIMPGKMKVIDSFFGYKTRDEMMLKYSSIETTCKGTLDFIEKCRSLIAGLRYTE